MTFDELIQSDTPVLVDYFATWCGPCQTMLPVLDALKSELGERVRIVKIDIDKNLDLAVAQRVMGVPTFAIYREGREVWRQAGVLTQFALHQAVENAIAPTTA
jgi:thioredoxin 1